MRYKWIADELNPLRDRNGMKFESEHHYNPHMDPEKSIKEAFNNIQNVVLSLVKPATRGVLIGGLAGGVINYLAGESSQKGIEIGAIYGGFIDLFQYNIRSNIEYFKSIKAAKRKFAKPHSDRDS